MKFNVEVEIDWIHSEDSLDEGIQKKLKREVVKKIWDKIEDKVDEQVMKVAEERVNQHMDEKIQKEASVLAKSGKFSPSSRYYKGPEDPTIEEYMRYQFSGKSKLNIEEVLKDRAEKIAEKLKDKYDIHFAQQVILKMRDQNLLKDDVEGALFESKMKDEGTDAN
ncbi:hypothetical protein [Fodinibius sp.]|uniref:hypothetical protein n=1 Tax=Fodinibius sp. TaxID=1872440 RepID=UPI002ACD6A2A|nr:hypothetical protein [Fodinibius sp.]MDZ7658036.1 hypothetical protein [Fodinibius sp.]